MITRSKAKTQALFDEVGWNRDVNYVLKLLLQGTDVNAKDDFMNTPLHLALKPFTLDTFRKLESELADSGSSRKYAGESQVWKIIETRIRRGADIVDLLLQRGANANAKNRGKCMPLQLATRLEKVSNILTDLQKIWPDIDWYGHIGNSLSKAASQTAIRIVKLLLSNGANINAEHSFDPSSVFCNSSVYKFRDSDEMPAFLEAKLYMGKSPLHTAVEFGSTSVVELLLKHQANTNARIRMGETPLHMAVNNNLRDIVKLLLKHGANVNARNFEGETQLIDALWFDDLSTVELLLEHGANVNVEEMGSLSYQTPLNYAVSFLSPKMVEVLLEHGAHVDPEDSLIPSLIRAVERPSLEIAKLLLEHGACVNAEDVQGRTALHLAFEIHCLGSFKDMLDLLLEHGADLEFRDADGCTPLFYIDNCSFHRFSEELSSKQQLLAACNEIFSHGVCVDVTDQTGQTFYDYLTACSTFESDEVKQFVFLNHIEKLIALSAIHMAGKNRPLFFDIVDPFKEDYYTKLEHNNRVYPQEDDIDIYESCLDELDELETIQIVQNITLNDVLTLGDPVTLASISNNVVFQRYAQSVDLNSKFPNYAFVISHQYQRGLQMQSLYEICEVILRIVSSGKFHRYCAHEILKYLSATDLKNLADAVNR